MASLTFHLLVPLLAMLAIPGIDRRKAFWLLPLVLLPDLDHFVGVHRSWLHNVFLLAPTLAVALHAHRRRDRETREWMLVATAYLASHLVLDVFVGGATLLWPFTDYNVCYYFTIVVATATNTPHFYYGDCSAPGAPTTVEFYPWLDYDETAAWAFILVAILAVGVLKVRRFVSHRRKGVKSQASGPRDDEA
ncbi:MAG TPA: metal-dependent hydrolase [Candidatus Thermoplasmatota archaeon]|nr:metal-dependent hydrolase [Candidatus Thermoplasmatota archaeon]